MSYIALMSLAPGTSLGPYEIAAKLGEGGMGEVYCARDARLNRDVAVKVLPADFANDAERLGRFKGEAQFLAALDYPNIAAIHGLEEVDGQILLVLELVESEDLSHRMARGAVLVDEAIAIATQIVEALEEAHEKGIVHRDLDFGLAKSYSTDASGACSFDSANSPTMTHAAIGWTYVMLADGYMPENEAYPLAKAAAPAAIERDELVADAHAVLGYSQIAYDWDPLAAKRELRRAIELDPNSAISQQLFGTYLCTTGRTDEALAPLDRAVRLDPLSPHPPSPWEDCLHWAHRYDDVIAAHRKVVELAPDFHYLDSFDGTAHRELGNSEDALRVYEESGKRIVGEPQYGLAITHARMGRTKEARDILWRLDDCARSHYVPLMSLAAIHANLGDMDAAIALLQRSLDTRESVFVYGRRIPELAPMLGDRRAQRLLDQVKPLEPTKLLAPTKPLG